jgi:hypothetical protein
MNQPSSTESELPDSFFRKLPDDEEKEFRQWARENYVPGTRINPTWHPVVRQECNLINTGVNPGGKVETN